MFALIESGPDHRPGFGWTGKLTSVAAHAGLVLAAASISRVDPAPPRPRADTAIVWTTPQPVVPVRPAPQEAGLPNPLPVLQRVIPPIVTPVDVPTEIAPPGVVTPGPGTWDTLHLEHGTPGVTTPGSLPDAPRDVRVVDEPPVLLSHPPVRYPETMRLAGIEARVVVETVLDSLGRAEPAATRVAVSALEPFDREAVAVVLASRYRAARVNGRAVRVRVAVPVNFAIR